MSFTPWVEKHRPSSVSDLAHQESIVAALGRFISPPESTKDDSKSPNFMPDVPHLLLYGPPGTGKTTAAWAMAKAIYGHNTLLLKERVLELNASDERGINSLVPKVKGFASTAVSARVVRDATLGRDVLVPSYKLVILDESDAMTPWAQTALRRIIENHVRSTRFILICNYVSRIIDPLVSRCAKFRFRAIPPEAMQHRLQKICELENVRFFPRLCLRIAQVAAGDMRRAVTLLQTVVAFNADALLRGDMQESVDAASDARTEDALIEGASDVAGVVPDAAVQGLLDAAATGLFSPVQQAVQEMTMSGFAGNTVVSQLFDALVKNPSAATDDGDEDMVAGSLLMSDVRVPASFRDKQRSKIAISLAEADAAMNDGSDELLQILNALTSFSVKQ